MERRGGTRRQEGRGEENKNEVIGERNMPRPSSKPTQKHTGGDTTHRLHQHCHFLSTYAQGRVINAAQGDALPALISHSVFGTVSEHSRQLKSIDRTAHARSGGGPHRKPLHLKLCRELFRKSGRTAVLRKFDRQIGDGIQTCLILGGRTVDRLCAVRDVLAWNATTRPPLCCQRQVSSGNANISSHPRAVAVCLHKSCIVAVRKRVDLFTPALANPLTSAAPVVTPRRQFGACLYSRNRSTRN